MEKTFEKVRNIIQQEMDGIAAKGELDENSLVCLYKMVDILKDMDEIEMKMDGGYSQTGHMRMYPDYGMNSYRGGNGYQGGGNSYGRNMNSYRGNSYRGGYSRDGENEHMMNRMQQMMNDAQTEQERETIRRMMETM